METSVVQLTGIRWLKCGSGEELMIAYQEKPPTNSSILAPFSRQIYGEFVLDIHQDECPLAVSLSFKSQLLL